ncbi:Protein DMR6-LIKE OXYGENASE 1 [Camellia lanceoleosa]|nr:Protein DMR6-LIKE OXYGENASE 1 [Camellia lanceoleosa]
MSPIMVLTVETRKEDDKLESQYQKGVKHLSDNGIEKLPNKYILPGSERPNLLLIKELAYACKHNNLKLPVIDLTELQGPNRFQALNSLANACEHHGFFQGS